MIGAWGTCRHCNRHIRIRCRGLCYTCWRHKDIRRLYPLEPSDSIVSRYGSVIAILIKEGATDSDVASELEVTRGVISLWRRAHGIPPRGRRGRCLAGHTWHYDAIRLHETGRTVKEIAGHLQRTQDAVKQVLLRKCGTSAVPQPPLPAPPPGSGRLTLDGLI